MANLTRQQIVEIVERRGFSISARTLRYWEQAGQIPKATRDGVNVCHSDDVIPTVVLLAATRPQQVKKLRANFGNTSMVTQTRIDGNTLVLTVRTKSDR